MLYRADTLMKKASMEGCGVIGTGIFDINSIEWCFCAAYDNKSPLIINCNLSCLSMDEAVNWTKYYARRYPIIPTALVAEGISTYDEAVKAVFAGFTGIALSKELELNVENTDAICEITKVARAGKVSVEVYVNVNEIDDVQGLICRTKVDSLKIVLDDDAEELENIKRIRALRNKVNLPLAFGDISDISEDYLNLIYSEGVSKFDIYNSYCSKVAKSTYDYFISSDKNPFVLLDIEEQKKIFYGKIFKEKLDLVKSSRRCYL